MLRGLDGFVCHRRGSNQLDTNRSTYDVFHLSFRDGAYQIRGAERKLQGGTGRHGCASTADLQPCPQAAEVGSGTLAVTGACAVTVTWRRISSLSSESVAAWPSVPSAASTCVAVPQGCCVLTRTCLWGKLSGNIEDSQGVEGSTPEPWQPSIKALVAQLLWACTTQWGSGRANECIRSPEVLSALGSQSDKVTCQGVTR